METDHAASGAWFEDSRYVGPFKILQLHDSSAKIESLHDSNPVRVHVHLDQLKPFFAGNPVLAPDWDDALDLVLRGQYGTIEEEEELESGTVEAPEAQEERGSQQEHDQKDFGPDEEERMAPSQEQVMEDERMLSRDDEHAVIMREPPDLFMEQEPDHLRDDNVVVTEEAAMEEDDTLAQLRPRKRSTQQEKQVL